MTTKLFQSRRFGRTLSIGLTAAALLAGQGASGNPGPSRMSSSPAPAAPRSMPTPALVARPTAPISVAPRPTPVPAPVSIGPVSRPVPTQAPQVPSSLKPVQDYARPPSGNELRSLPPVAPVQPPSGSAGGYVLPTTRDKGITSTGITAGGSVQTPTGGVSGSVTSVPGLDSVQATGNRQVAPNVNVQGGASASSAGEKTGNVGVTITTP